MRPTKVAVILPSRGLIFSETAEEILKNLKGIPHKIFFAHGLALPECFEKPTRAALSDKTFTHLWFVEDDMKLPENALKCLLNENANAITYDYPINKEGRGATFYDIGGRVIFCGTGCLLVKREVFKGLKKPYFTDRIRWTMLNYGERIKITGHYLNEPGYGLHDITFCMKLWKNGVIVKSLPQTLAQRKLISLGKSGSNDGAHNIQIWEKIVPNAWLTEVQSQPVAPGANSALVSVITPEGEIQTSAKHAQTLVDKGLAHFPAKSYVILDIDGVVL